MSAFEVSITPKRGGTMNLKRPESREPTDVIMAPFSAKSVVQFEDVPVTKTARRILKIINPSDETIEVRVTKPIRSDHNVTIDWTEKAIPRHSIVDMEMVWTPLLDVICKETMQLTDNRNFRKDVSVLLKTKCNQPSKSTRKFPTMSSGVHSHVTTLRLKSPTGATRGRRNVGHRQSPRRTASNKSAIASHPPQKWVNVTAQQPSVRRRVPAAVAQRENIPVVSRTASSSTAARSANAANASIRTMPLAERNIYLHENGKPQSAIDSVAKKNSSPSTPSNMLDLIEQLNFTPAAATQSHRVAQLEDLASLPTPKTGDYYRLPAAAGTGTLREHKITRRRITNTELLENDCDGAAESICQPNIVIDRVVENVSPVVISNKTFDVSRTEALHVLADVLDVSSTENAASSCASGTLNRTTTLLATPAARTLAMIQEEESSYHNLNISAEKLEQTYTKEQHRVRDVQLVGTPLRKHAESMQDLSLRSPQTKLGIQGSMPNLNEMQLEHIRPIEQNRYFYSEQKSAQPKLAMEIIHEHRDNDPPSYPNVSGQKQQALNTEEFKADCAKDASITSIVSPVEMKFNQNEILAQSSRFNLNEISVRSLKGSQVNMQPPAQLSHMLDQSNKKLNAVSDKQFMKEPIFIGQKRRASETSLLDILSTESLASSSCTSRTNINTTKSVKGSPPKRQRLETDFAFARPSPPTAPANASASTPRARNWGRVQPKKLRLATTLSLLRKPVTPRKERPEALAKPPAKFFDADLYLQQCINPDPFAATTTCDPFLASTMYLDERAVDKHQTDFKKWLNALLSVPADLDADCSRKIDVGKLFNEVRNKELTLALSKEQQSVNYLNKYRLQSLRHAAVLLFTSDEIRVPFGKVAVYISRKAIRIRNDRNLHLDVVMQRTILEILLCINPLWLRLGLEVVFGEEIHLQSNNDIVGLSTFILNRLFRDKYIEQKYSRAYTLTDEYADHIKTFTLQKMLALLLFLDKAKTRRIIKHNPCLFVQESPYKETREILLRLSSELLANIGDITRELKRLGYVLEYKQTYLEGAFNYAVNNLAVDLRDGIRLTRIMELILLRDDLTSQLRAPAISRLQRIFNVKVALGALSKADFQLKGDITAQDIVDGHREKTLSLLWQIIYKFRSPKFHAAARVLQQWWRRRWLHVFIARRIREKAVQRRERAAARIQAFFRGIVARKYVKLYRTELTKAAIVLQKNVRRFLAMRQLATAIAAAVIIQRRFRALLHGAKVRREYMLLRTTVTVLQKRYRAKRALAAQRAAYLHMRQLVVCVQQCYRARLQMKQQRAAYLKIRTAIVCIQQKWRATRQMRCERMAFITMQYYATVVQQKYRARKTARVEHATYLQLRASVVAVQRRYRGKLLMRSARAAFLRKQQAVLTLQRRFRAHKQMRFVRAKYRGLREATICIQQHFRSFLQTRRDMERLQQVRHAALVLQRRYRARLAMRQMRQRFVALNNAAICIQKRYRAKLLMHQEMLEYKRQRQLIIMLQRRFRAKRLARTVRKEYAEQRLIIVALQQRVRATLVMRSTRASYLKQRTKIITIQRYFRSYLLMKQQHNTFMQQRQAAIKLQRWRRSLLQMREQRQNFQRVRFNTIIIQRKWRATLAARQQRQKFEHTLCQVRFIQRKLRATLKMRQERNEFQRKKAAIIALQRRFRAQRVMLQLRSQYLLIRLMVVHIQRRYRSHRAMLVARADFLLMKRTAVHLQQKFRGRICMLEARERFLTLRQSTIGFQAALRGYLARLRFQALMTPEMVELLQRKKAARIIQRCWRGYRVRKRFHNIELKRIRTNIAMLKQNSSATDSIRSKLKNAVLQLRGRVNATEMLNLLSFLDRISRTVPHIIIGQADFICTFCYAIMAQAIRSEVDKHLIECCSRIILNLARYDSATSIIFQEGGLVTIAQMLLRWCDKDSEIFNTLCTLIWVFAHCPKKRRIIREFMTTPEALYLVRETKKQVARKEKMKLNARKPSSSHNKGFVPLPAQRHHQTIMPTFTLSALPSLQPDYGVISSKPYTFTSSVYAFDTILLKLGINIY